jgi:hypothetical protein
MPTEQNPTLIWMARVMKWHITNSFLKSLVKHWPPTSRCVISWLALYWATTAFSVSWMMDGRTLSA